MYYVRGIRHDVLFRSFIGIQSPVYPDSILHSSYCDRLDFALGRFNKLARNKGLLPHTLGFNDRPGSAQFMLVRPDLVKRYLLEAEPV